MVSGSSVAKKAPLIAWNSAWETVHYPAGVLTATNLGTNVPKMEEDDRPRPRGDSASKLATEDLGPYSQDELDERIALLEAEIARVESHRLRAAAHRDAAEALFGRKG